MHKPLGRVLFHQQSSCPEMDKMTRESLLALFSTLLVILCNMSLRQIRDSYFHLTYFSFSLLFFICYHLINDLTFFDFFL